MIDKIKTILTIALIVIVVFAIGFCIVKLILSAFEDPELITMENIQSYMQETQVVTAYSTYFYYENCMKNFVEACEKEMYQELYDIYIKDYKKDSSKEDIISKLKNVNTILTPKDMDEEIKYSLKTLYFAGENYLAEIKVNENTIYLVFGETSSKDIDYNFAIVK